MIFKCPKCEKAMCQQFDEVERDGMTMLTPNGEYMCRWCGYDSTETRKAGTQ